MILHYKSNSDNLEVIKTRINLTRSTSSLGKSEHFTVLSEKGSSLVLIVADRLDGVVNACELVNMLEGNEFLLSFLGELHRVDQVEVLGNLELFRGDLTELSVGYLNLNGIVNIEPICRKLDL